MSSRTYDVPENPGFIGGIFWPGFIVSWLVRLVALQIICALVAYAALRSGIAISSSHLSIFGISVYPFWHLMLWWIHYWREILSLHRSLFGWSLIAALPACLIAWCIGGVVPNFLYRSKIKRYASHQHQLYGSNRWATIEDLRANRLLDGEGLLLGAFAHDG